MKIEKLEHTTLSNKECMLPDSLLNRLCNMHKKINELVDAFNEHETRLDNQLKWLGELREQTIKKEEKEPEIKNCPFCNETPHLHFESRLSYNNPEIWSIWCANDECLINPTLNKRVFTRKEAIAAWNKRAK